MKEICQKSNEFLSEVFKGAGLDLQTSVVSTDDKCSLDLFGADSLYLRVEGAELLDALEHLVNQVFGHGLTKGERIICDVEGFRSAREAELRVMAQHAAERVKSTGAAFTFGPMEANERRVIHLSLSEDRMLETMSLGEGPERRVKISLKTP